VLTVPVLAYVGLGANLGDPRRTVLEAMQALNGFAGVTLRKQSSLYSSTPVDAGGDDYINAVVQLETRLKPHDLLRVLHAVEQDAGRQRPYRNAPRTLDLDLLLYASDRVDSADLQVPHPRMWERAFVLLPLAEIAPELVSAMQIEAVSHQGVWRAHGEQE